jgi:FSR family fosmidomycin resistance protein-like MFS transporter
VSAAGADTDAGVDRRALGILAAGHGCADLCQGAVPALLPFLVAQRGLSLTAAAALITASTIGSSIVQPLFGIWSDRLATPLLLPAGVALGSIGIGLAGLCESYALLMAVLLVSGIGVAAFHPEGARYVSYASRGARSRGMSVFALGGNAGFALGPALVTPVVATLGLSATPLLAIPGLVVSGLLLAALRDLRACADGAAGGGEADSHAPEAADQWRPFSRLAGAAVARTTAFFALQAFVPIYLLRHFDTGSATAGAALTAMLVAGAVGTLLGGWCADRYGARRVLVCSMVPLAALLLALPHVGLVAFFVCIAGVGLAIDAPFSTTIVLGQSYLPRRIALSSGITYGLAIGLGGLAATALGALADATSVTAVLAILPVFALAALGFSASLPRTPALQRGGGSSPAAA